MRKKSGCRGNSDETRDSTGAEADCGPLLLETVIEENPSNSTDRSSEMGDDARHNSTQVGSEGRATIEAEPADP
jgi:hypothetical protein